MYGSVSISSLVAGDERVLAADDFSYVFLRGETKSLAFLRSFSEIFGRSQLRLQLLKILPTDLLGYSCAHCNEQIVSPDDLALGLHNFKIKTILHESCFARWFLRQDKPDISPYRFLTVKSGQVSCEAPYSSFVCGDIELPSPVPLTFLASLDFKAIALPTERSISAEVTTVVSNGDKSGVNMFFCPRCNATQEISFLDTEDKIHSCSKCHGRFQIIVREVR